MRVQPTGRGLYPAQTPDAPTREAHGLPCGGAGVLQSSPFNPGAAKAVCPNEQAVLSWHMSAPRLRLRTSPCSNTCYE